MSFDSAIVEHIADHAASASVLTICPKALVAERKWAVEMKRFDEHFTPLDGNLLRHCLKRILTARGPNNTRNPSCRSPR